MDFCHCISKLLQTLTHVPVLQIGSDVFVDTALIIEELERRYPEPTLSKKEMDLIKAIEDSVYPWHGFVDRLHHCKEPSTPKFFSSKELLEDRSSLIGSPINQKNSYLIDQIRSNLEWIELQLSGDREWFFDTPYPSIADTHVAMNVWFLDFIKGANEITKPDLYPKTYSWLDRFLKYIKIEWI
ncbi:11780_t:CDS:2 [Funneliformis geosporum]|nr:11780_t:CDS:2 [Funneliformis geosporum]